MARDSHVPFNVTGLRADGTLVQLEVLAFTQAGVVGGTSRVVGVRTVETSGTNTQDGGLLPVLDELRETGLEVADDFGESAQHCIEQKSQQCS